MEKPKRFKRKLRGELDDIELLSEAPLKRVWLNNSDEIWNRYLKDDKK